MFVGEVVRAPFVKKEAEKAGAEDSNTPKADTKVASADKSVPKPDDAPDKDAKATEDAEKTEGQKS
jgi:hypothetical protein